MLTLWFIETDSECSEEAAELEEEEDASNGNNEGKSCFPSM